MSDEWTDASVTPNYGLPMAPQMSQEDFDTLAKGIRLRQAAAEKAARIEKAHELYKIGEYTQSEFLAVMIEEAGPGR